MPRKTKKEKLAAQLRRLKYGLGETATAKTSPKEQSINLTNIKLERNLPEKQVKSSHDYSYIFNDLRKIGFIATGMIGLEIVLNLTLRTSFAKLVLRTLGIEI